ncbi:hypothetical protein FLM9_1233 [Candidatus Synechococcus spongiarum]|uniref:Uncharacterized protein n=1 Tax=Candidatus Synechococcus spongiarum TaxID=431041 RepID=A0A164YY60_9SYNE|nr:hypothetical protein FLM9_1233 [Candidatus Synechococcus spongiarum]
MQVVHCGFDPIASPRPPSGQAAQADHALATKGGGLTLQEVYQLSVVNVQSLS